MTDSVGIFSTQLLPVRKDLRYGGVETFLYYLCEEFGKRDIDYTLYAPKGSVAKGGTLVETIEPPKTFGTDEEVRAFQKTRETMSEHSLVNDHSHSGVGYIQSRPVLKTLHGLSTWPGVPCSKPNFVTLSEFHRMVTRKSLGRDSRVVFNGLDVDDFVYNDSPDDYYLHFGLMVEHKGAHVSIGACKDLGLKLKVAGEDQFMEDKKKAYVRSVRASCDGKDIEYIGAVDFATKCKLMSKAKAVLLPFMQYEMYSLILIESLLHGTPVVVFPMGAITEMVTDKVAMMPHIINSNEDRESLSAAGMSLDMTSYRRFPEIIKGIDRSECRRYAENKFSVKRSADAYIALYDKIRGGERW